MEEEGHVICILFLFDFLCGALPLYAEAQSQAGAWNLEGLSPPEVLFQEGPGDSQGCHGPGKLLTLFFPFSFFSSKGQEDDFEIFPEAFIEFLASARAAALSSLSYSPLSSETGTGGCLSSSAQSSLFPVLVSKDRPGGDSNEPAFCFFMREFSGLWLCLAFLLWRGVCWELLRFVFVR